MCYCNLFMIFNFDYVGCGSVVVMGLCLWYVVNSKIWMVVGESLCEK